MSSNNLATKSDIANLFEELEKAKQNQKLIKQYLNKYYEKIG